MHSFLHGFWTTGGVPAGLLFFLVAARDTKRMVDGLPDHIYGWFSILLYAAPVLGMAWIWYRSSLNRGAFAIRGKRSKQYWIGGIAGLVIAYAVTYFMLPAFHHV